LRCLAALGLLQSSYWMTTAISAPPQRARLVKSWGKVMRRGRRSRGALGTHRGDQVGPRSDGGTRRVVSAVHRQNPALHGRVLPAPSRSILRPTRCDSSHQNGEKSLRRDPHVTEIGFAKHCRDLRLAPIWCRINGLRGFRLDAVRVCEYCGSSILKSGRRRFTTRISFARGEEARLRASEDFQS
jgi:hypothetical protein